MRRLYFNTADSSTAWAELNESVSPVLEAIVETLNTPLPAEIVVQETPTESMQELLTTIVETALVKARAKRKPKAVPLFWQEPQSNANITDVPVHFNPNYGILETEEKPVYHLTSPYVKMIPLPYLLHSQRFVSPYEHRSESNLNYALRRYSNNSILLKAKAVCRIPTGIGHIGGHLLTSGVFTESPSNSGFRTRIKEFYNEYIFADPLLNMSGMSRMNGCYNDTKSALINIPRHIHGRTFNVLVGGLSCFMSPMAYGNEYTPQMVAVVLPENYIYQKEYMMTHGKIDLTKVVILINKELDSTSFSYKPFRTYYRKYILPVINELKVDVWKVPISFIEEQCFHNGIKLKATSIIAMKQEVKEVVQLFHNHYAEGSPVFLQYEDMYEDDDDDEPESEGGDNYGEGHDDYWDDEHEEDGSSDVEF